MSSHAASLKASGDSGSATATLTLFPNLSGLRSTTSYRELSGRQDGVRGAPAIPCGNGSIRSKDFALSLKGARLGQVLELVRDSPAFAYRIVVHGPHVQPAQLEDEEHLGRPPADASHLHQAGDKIVV